MERYDRFDVVIVPFPFVDAPVVKRRPALSLTTAMFLEANGHGLFAMITSAKHSSWPSDVRLEEWHFAGLTADSVLRWKIFTLPVSAIQRRLGGLGTRDTMAATEALRDILRI